MRTPSFFLTAPVAVCLVLLLVPGCSDDAAGTSGGTPEAGTSRRFTGQQRPPASCEVVLEAPELLSSPHVAEGSPITYNSTPPSSGPHYGAWANFMEFDKPVAPGFLVHAMEHGAVVLLYKCDGPTGPGCGPLVDGLRQIRAAAKTDPACDAAIRVRIVIAPEPTLPTPIAAAAWGFTYKAACVDAPTLSKFVADNYALAPENFCVPGRSAF